jgi:uncharacterized protein YigA (DUF484 family)
MVTSQQKQTVDVHNLILDQTKTINQKLDAILQDMHAGTRRMDGLQRDFEDLDSRLNEEASRSDIHERKIAELEPVIEMTKNLKKLLYAAAAVVVALQFLPAIVLQIKGMK